MPPKTWIPVYVLILGSTLFMDKCESGSYEEKHELYKDLLNSSIYNVEIRPLDDQSIPLEVTASFQLVSIVGIDDVGERFHCNGFLALTWIDERLTWHPADYGGEISFHPGIKAIWKPRVLLLNTVTKRDLFEDNYSPLTVDYLGNAMWAPGSVFSSSCDLDMSNYPFDKQTCNLDLIANGYEETELHLHGTNEAVGKIFFSPSGEWDLMASNVTTKSFDLQGSNLVGVRISFTLQRRPTFLLLNVVIPVVLLSFLNILVFLIPVDSGEKLSYGITVLLAVSVFLSIISGMLPRSSEIVPNVTVYLACLLILSVLTVIDCIIIVFLHNLEENEDASIKATENFQRSINKIKHLNRAVAPMPRFTTDGQKIKSVDPGSGDTRKTSSSLSDLATLPAYFREDEYHENGHAQRPPSSKTGTSSESRPAKKNKYRLIGKHIDMVSFFVFFVIWFALTVGFMASISKDANY